MTFYQQWAMELALNAKPEELMFEGNQLRVEKEDKNHAQKKKIPLTAADIGYLKSFDYSFPFPLCKLEDGIDN